MKFRNPWVDPRIGETQPGQVTAYLQRRGWRPVGPAGNPHLVCYQQEGNDEAPTLFLPEQVEEPAALEWLIELVGDLARFEGRWAVSVLDDIVQGKENHEVNGAGEKVAAMDTEQ